MQNLLNRLAEKLGQGPFVADVQGKYHLRLDGYPLFLLPRHNELLLSTPWQVPSRQKVNLWIRHC